MGQSEFEDLLMNCKTALERYVYFKAPSKTDGDDILQNVLIRAFQQFNLLRDKNCFKAWILKIAANMCNDFYRERAKLHEIPLDEITESVLIQSRYGITVQETVRETLDLLPDKDKQIIFLYYFKNRPQIEIANQLKIPIGTVKSHLYTAKQKFKAIYPYRPLLEGENNMKSLPEKLPEYSITQLGQPPFCVEWKELMGWAVIPELGKTCTWAIYDLPSRMKKESYEMHVVRKAKVHGIEGVEITAKETLSDGSLGIERLFVAQETDTHTRFLLERHYSDDVMHYFTFLDTDEFIPNWGFGEDNCGNEIHVKQKGIIKYDDPIITCSSIPSVLDVVGRYSVEIGGKCFDTILVMDIEQYNDGVMSETYLDQEGRTVLWRRFNRDDWAYKHYKQLWSEILPNNQKVSINGITYVHWYDCITDYIL